MRLEVRNKSGLRLSSVRSASIDSTDDDSRIRIIDDPSLRLQIDSSSPTEEGSKLTELTLTNNVNNKNEPDTNILCIYKHFFIEACVSVVIALIM